MDEERKDSQILSPGKWTRGSYCGSSYSIRSTPKLANYVMVEGMKARALVDTGCTITLVTSCLVRSWSGRTHIKAVDGRVTFRGSSTLTLSVDEEQFKIKVLM